MSRRRTKRKRRREKAEPTLFDLPLQAGAEEAAAGVSATGAAPDAAAESAHGDAAGRGPSLLFDGDASGAQEDPQLEQLELAPGSAELPGAEGVADVSPIAGSASGAAPAAPADDKAFLGDRFLGGLADLAAQLIALGLAVAAVHSLGIAVTFADWAPFGVLMLVFSFLYWTVPLAFWGQTPGMSWVGHTARSVGGEPLSFGQTFLRWFGAGLTLALAGLPLLLALGGASLTDRISGSRTTAG